MLTTRFGACAMTDLKERIEKLSPKRLALLALELQQRLNLLERQRTEPIAIVGHGLPDSEKRKWPCRVLGGAAERS